MERKYTASSISPQLEKFLEPVVRAAGFDLTFVVVPGLHLHPDFEDPEVVVKFTGPDVELLLANRAELLLALEMLTLEALHVPSEDHSRLCFDANDYRVLRIEELRLSALAAAENVKKTGRPFHFNPMNSRERRLIHVSLRNETAVKSLSTGMGPIRQVVVMPVDMETVPEPIRPPRPPPPSDFRGGPPRGNDRRRGGPRDRR